MRLLFLTPPLLQPNSPYPATPHLTGFLESLGADVHQRDLSIGVVRDVLVRYGDETTEELLEFLGGSAPAEAKRGASEAIEEIARRIRDEVDPLFGFARYAEEECRALPDFGVLERLVRRRGVIDAPLRRRLVAAMEEVRPDAVAVTCPFPGTLVGAFKIARLVRRLYPGVRLMLGGGYVSTELREMTDPRPYRYFDEFQFDEGYGYFSNLKPETSTVQPPTSNLQPNLLPNPKPIPPFIRPSYRGIDWNDYFDVVETDNFVTNLWSAGKWVKLIMARGCYWHRCAFCDVRLPYIGCFRMPDPSAIVDCMEDFARPNLKPETLNLKPETSTVQPSTSNLQPRLSSFHFVDEAMPPKLVRGVCEEILRRGLEVEWWGNVRFDAAFTPALARMMARAGCVAVTGGLECANDRLLKLMNKGITLAGAERVLEGFRKAGIFVHAYLMYGFPTETKSEQRGAERYVKSLARRGLIQSAFWHRFALTVHSPIYAEAERFGIVVDKTRPKRLFALNEVPFEQVLRF